MTEKKILVTGSCGYIGSHIVQQLLIANQRVKGTVKSLDSTEQVAPLRALVPNAKHPLELVEIDLLKDEGWDEAMAGCWAVIHVACPQANIMEEMLEEDLMVPCVQGALRMLRAATRAKINRIVITGSFSSVNGDPIPSVEGKTYTEDDWTEVDYPHLDPYAKSKTSTEMTAWKYVEEVKDKHKIELTVLLPTFVWGPPLLKHHGSSNSVMVMNLIMNHTYPGNPRLHGIFCDVRDVAKAHIKCLTSSKAIGKRILVHSSSMWMADVSKLLAQEFGPQGYTIYTHTVPYFLLWLMSFFNRKMVLTGFLDKIGKELHADNSRMVNILGIKPRPVENTVLDMVYAMIDLGVTYRTKNYKKVGPRAEK